jgi:GcrA cell cycle regulator
MWTEERLALAKKLYEDGLSASQVAWEVNKTGSHFSRNAVIGVAHRKGWLGRRKQGVRVPRAPHFKTRPKAEIIERFEDIMELSTTEDDLATPLEQRKTLLQLTEATCHWPVGDPATADFFFCGAVSEENSPYCLHHSRRAFNGAPVRTREIRPFRR